MYMTPQACADAGAAYPDYELFIGFDVGKSFHVAHARDRAGGKVGSGRADNVEAAVDAFLARTAGCEVAYLTGKREKKARELFPGVAKNDAKDAEVIAAAAAGMPQSLLPVPEEDDGLEGARRLRSQLSFAVKQRTQCMNRVRAALVESNGAFERFVDLDRAWALDVLERIGGPWQVPGAGRERLARSRGAPAGRSSTRCGSRSRARLAPRRSRSAPRRRRSAPSRAG